MILLSVFKIRLRIIRQMKQMLRQQVSILVIAYIFGYSTL